MTDAAAQLVGFVGPWLGAAFVVFLRIGAIASVFPGIGEHSVPVRVRLVLALALTAIVLPVVGPEIRVAAREPAFIAACLATESAIGLAFGIVFRLLVNALETAGAMIAQSASLSQLFGAGGEPMPAISHLLVAGGLALAVASGLHLRLVTLLIESYTLFPAGALFGLLADPFGGAP